MRYTLAIQKRITPCATRRRCQGAWAHLLGRSTVSEYTEKSCNKCKEPFPATSEYFHRNSKEKDGLCRTCKECAKTRARQWNVDNVERASESSKLYYQANSEIIKARSAQRYLDHTEKMNQQARARHEINRDRDNANNRANRLKHIERETQRTAEWVAAHPERRREIANNYGKSAKGIAARVRRRARERGLPATFTSEQWLMCLSWWHNTCAYCGEQKPLCADHFVPLASVDCPGTIAENMLPACKSCNSSKMDRDFVEWSGNRVDPFEHAEILSRIGAYFDIA